MLVRRHLKPAVPYLSGSLPAGNRQQLGHVSVSIPGLKPGIGYCST
jgi:hypothetical protein